MYLESLLDVSWYTADSKKPYLIKAGATVKNGYSILITDLESTYFCAETEDYHQLISLIHDAFSKYDSNSTYHFNKVSRDQIYFKLQKQMEIYPFKWEFYCIQIPHDDHVSIIKNFLVAPLISTVNTLEQQYKDKLMTEKEKLKFQCFENDHTIWNKSISVDETLYSDFPQFKQEKSIQQIFSTLQNSRFKSKQSMNNLIDLYGQNKKREYEDLNSKQKLKHLRLDDDEDMKKPKLKKDKVHPRPLLNDLDEGDETDPEEVKRRQEIERKLQKKHQEDSQIAQLSQQDIKKKKPKKNLKFI
ncbi:UNKNOWN [Stylonychia lemnae]|uniref:Uncharacterized protein n=1 Tax=Stylonychia lemnae TaxID=5949 RepID=A0A077ZYT5_STYLE|nr:UNKNOWN [Stylonychia lemnae]|eukprot:CDW73698.1 UNKNOWN [Stylonychia lemnae]